MLLAAGASITADDMRRRVTYLASDGLRGRATPSPGLDSAASYLAATYARLRLEARGDDGTFYQRYLLRTIALDTARTIFGTVLADGSTPEMMEYGRDFFALPGGLPARGEPAVRLVYVGFLRNGALPAGDYRGALPVVVIPGGYRAAWTSDVVAARTAAAAAGAPGVVLIADSTFSPSAFRRFAASSVAERTTQLGPVTSGDIPVFVLTYQAFRAVTAREGTMVDHTAGSAAVFATIRARVAAPLRVVEESMAPNIVAVLRGSDPHLRDEYVLLSAHVDHLGVGTPVAGDSIYNGADDNASGTAALVEIAEAFAALPVRPRRSILFLHVSGEERHILGSEWFSSHPTVPAGRIVADLNVDMIGRNNPDSVVVVGKSYSSLGVVAAAVQAKHPELHLTLADDIWPEKRLFFRSDHYNFARRDIPSIFFFAGEHEDYHRPTDTVDRLDVEKAARIARMIFYLAYDIATVADRPRWTSAGLAAVRPQRP